MIIQNIELIVKKERLSACTEPAVVSMKMMATADFKALEKLVFDLAANILKQKTQAT